MSIDLILYHIKYNYVFFFSIFWYRKFDEIFKFQQN
jgi:hypothetical protein